MDFEALAKLRNETNPYAKRMGIVVEEIRLGYARVKKTITAEDLNPVQVAHGGCCFSMADTACGSAMASYGCLAVTVCANCNFLRSANVGDTLTAEAQVTKPGRTVSVFSVRVTDGAGRLLGDGSFTFYRLAQEGQAAEPERPTSHSSASSNTVD